MARRRRNRPKGSRVAGRLLRWLCASCGTTLAIAAMVISVLMVGSKYTTAASGENDCTLPEVSGGSGVEIFGDSALAGLAKTLPGTLNSGRVRADVQPGRTAEQAVNELNALPDSAPATFVISLEQDDPGELASYTNDLEELALLLAGRNVLWVTVPGKAALTNAVISQNTGETGDWRIVDFASAAAAHRTWWRGHSPTSQGLTALARTVTTALASSDGTGMVSTGSQITVLSTTTSEHLRVSGDRKKNAQTIISTGLSLDVPQRGLVIAMAAAIQESRLVNLTGGDQDSLGLFQQRPSQGWGTAKQILNPRHAATQFFTRLLQTPNWQSLPLTDAAQAVQHSGLPDAYAQWEQAATTIVAALQGKHVPGCGPQEPTAGNPKAPIAVQAALSQLGVPYSFGGGDLHGPTRGICAPGAGWNDCHIVGFDCSGLMLYAWGTAGVTVPQYTVDMWNDPAFIHIADQTELQPGDMVMFETNGVPEHTGMYIGHGDIVQAPRSGDVVKTTALNAAWYQQHYLGAIRPKA